MWQRALERVGRYRFTLLLLAVLGLVAWFTDSTTGPLAKAWLARFGFAPRDLAAGNWRGLLLSALVTHGGWTFWRASAMVALFVGLCERRLGAWRTAAAFFGVHLAVLALIGGGLWLQMSQTGTTWLGPLPLPRDIGPSAGAFGCLGLAVGLAPGRLRYLIAAGGLVPLVAALALPPLAAVAPAVDLLADLAHLLAFVLGWLLSLPWRDSDQH